MASNIYFAQIEELMFEVSLSQYCIECLIFDVGILCCDIHCQSKDRIATFFETVSDMEVCHVGTFCSCQCGGAVMN